ncbi:glycosyltransferase [Candidatus Pelagibacter sp.]|nr:glycosyltransferase [Candidatus Pelagibacter sp.]
MKILHVITGLGNGGAESTLYKICKYDHGNEHIVISITRGGKYHSMLKKIGIKVYCINLKFYSILKFIYFIKLFRLIKPDILQTWLILGDLLGGVGGRLAGIKNIVWNIHHSKLVVGTTKLRNIFFISVLAKLSYLIPKYIVVVSKNGIKNCKNLGYCKKKLCFIPNGYELSVFNHNKNQELYLKKIMKIKKKIPLIGTVSRYDPIKDHINLLNALSFVKLKKIDFLCILIGHDVDNNNKVLVNEINRLQLNNHVKLLGSKNNIPQIMNSLDIHVLSSISEAFPNVIVEAMACKTPCIATDVGDCRYIIGKTGWVVPPKNSLKLAYVIEKALSQIDSINWNRRRNLARLRIEENFDISKMLESFNKLWARIYLDKN